MADAPKILGTDSLRQAYPKLNQAIENSNEAINKSTTSDLNSSTAVSTANEAKTQVESIQNQLNQVIIEGDSSVEAAQARLDNEGIAHTTLKERIDYADVVRVKLAYDIDSTSYKAGEKVDINYLKGVQARKYALAMRKLRTGQPTTFTHKGDSLTYGYDVYSADIRPADTNVADDGTVPTQTRASKTYPEAFVEYMNSVYGTGKITSINQGYSGDWASIAMTRYYKKHSGDVTIIMFGTNDARSTTSCPYGGDVEQYIYWMEQLIIRELIWDKAVVLFTPPKFRQAGTAYGADDVDTFAHALHLLGMKYNIPVVDTQEFHANQSYSVYSDAVHFNGEGYKILGAKAASLFIGEGVANPKLIGQGSTLLVRPMLDNIHYIGNAIFDSAGTTGTPDEIASGQGVFANMDAGGSFIYSFYNTDDNLMLFPSFLAFSGATVKITIDFDVNPPQRSLDSVYFLAKNQHEDLPTNASYIDVTTYNKTVMLQNDISPLMVTNKGWHTVKVESIGAKTYFYGFEFMGFQEYQNTKNSGSLKRTELYGGTVASGIVTLSGDITKFKTLLVVTGSPTDGTLQTGVCSSFNTTTFRVNTDYIRVPTADGYFLAQVTGNTQITIQNANNNLRYIYGINEYLV